MLEVEPPRSYCRLGHENPDAAIHKACEGLLFGIVRILATHLNASRNEPFQPIAFDIQVAPHQSRGVGVDDPRRCQLASLLNRPPPLRTLFCQSDCWQRE